MAFIRVPNTVMVEMIFRQDGQYVENVYHCSNAVSYDESDMANLIDVFRTWWDTDIQPLVTSNLSLVNFIATDLDSQTGPRVEDASGLPLAGSLAGASMPNNVTLVVKWTTGNRGRSFRGRTYHLGLEDGQVTQNTIAATPLANLTTAYNNLIVDVTTAGWTLVVASRYADNAPRAEGITTPITLASIEGTVDSQRRRLPGRGA